MHEGITVSTVYSIQLSHNYTVYGIQYGMQYACMMYAACCTSLLLYLLSLYVCYITLTVCCMPALITFLLTICCTLYDVRTGLAQLRSQRSNSALSLVFSLESVRLVLMA
jgi:hypothetical protein